jgi:hypothetical protein
VNRNTLRLASAVLVAWLTGALGGLAVMPAQAFVFVFVAVLVLPMAVAYWDSDRLATRYRHPGWRVLTSRAERDRANYISGWVFGEIVTNRYRLVWLVVTMALGLLAALVNMLGGFSATVVLLDGQPVHATLMRQEETKSRGDYFECVLAHPDGRRIPGTLASVDEGPCGTTEDVIVDPHGLVDPVRQADIADSGGPASVGAVFLGLALLTCVPAAWPRRNDDYVRPKRRPPVRRKR